MQINNATPNKWLKMIETIGLIVIPLMIVLGIGLWFRSQGFQSVAQAKNAPTETPSAGNTPIQGDGIPNAAFASVSVNGITFYAGNYRLSKGQLLADVCFDMIDNADWIIADMQNSHIVDAQGHQSPIIYTSAIEIRYAPKLVDGKLKQFVITDNKDEYKDASPNQKMGQRCDTLYYTLPSDFDMSKFTITINSITRNPGELDACGSSDTPYIKKIQAELDKKKTGIKVKSAHDNGQEGVCGVVVVEKPQKMSQDAAQNIAVDNEMLLDLFGIRGPWVFEGSIK